MFSRYFVLLIWVSVLIAAVVLVLSQIKKKVHVIAEVEAAQVAFELTGTVDNFLGINNTVQADYALRISSYEQARFPYQQLRSSSGELLAEAPGELLLELEEGDPTAAILMDEVAIGSISLRASHRVVMVTGGTQDNSMRIDLARYGQPISFTNLSDTLLLKPKRSLASWGDALQDWENEPLLLQMAYASTLTAHPLDSSISLRLRFDDAQYLAEDDIVRVDHLAFTENKGGQLHSSILKGKITIDETEKTIEFGKNKSLSFALSDEFDITELTLYNDRIRLVFEGETDAMLLGFARDRYIPSVLEYLYHNNFLIILFNSYLVVLTFFISIYNTYRDKK